MNAPRMSALGLNSSDGLVKYGRYQWGMKRTIRLVSRTHVHEWLNHCSFGKLLEPRILS